MPGLGPSGAQKPGEDNDNKDQGHLRPQGGKQAKVGDHQVGKDEQVTRDCGTPPPPPTPTPTPPTPTPTPFLEILEVERLPVTGAVAPSGPFGAPWLSVIGLLLIASGGILHWLKKRE